jgi:hypothetical protein
LPELCCVKIKIIKHFIVLVVSTGHAQQTLLLLLLLLFFVLVCAMRQFAVDVSLYRRRRRQPVFVFLTVREYT